MNTILWIGAGILASAFLAAGLTKATQPKEKLAPNMAWVEDYSSRAVRLIGIAEIVGAVGLILPAAVRVAVWLTPLAAAALAVTMLLGAAAHVRRGEIALAIPSGVLFVLTAAVAILRFGPYAF
ncbi:hypothetical protein Back2_27430 [Nocardioides baekrokdamisoli]|uniref:DoxX family protein n=1 Tax=Nocardioides baekrokdamisoli TaxID=1804624 RepID=A0A3G9IJI9_9ACTN|nr:DoxX family protein [Nocardioides baekrokdamisoli]BBH18456.1 hypothetical protein Back2_27430 [Nocardioides baekrokdamisoli]